MANYTITLTDSEDKAMQWVAYSVQDWADNALKERARHAINDLYDSEVARMTADPDITTIPADKNQVVLDYDGETAKETSDRIDAETAAKEAGM
jgi:hypothetical protein